MKKGKYITWMKKIILGIFLGGFISLNFLNITNTVFAERFDVSLEDSVNKVQQLKQDIEVQVGEGGGATIRNFIFDKTINIVIPLVILVGIIFAIIGFYRVIFSEDAETTRVGFQYIAYGVIGIIIMMSARYITDILTGDMLSTGANFSFEPKILIRDLYDKIVFPFIKVLIYIILGGLFIIFAMQLIRYIFSTDDSARKGAGTIITWNIIGMLTIIGSKQIIEAIYGSQEKILNQNIQTLGDVGDAILTTKELPLLYTVINRVMGITSLVILIIIIWQSFQLLTQPTDSNQFSKIRRSLLYIFAGILVIGAGYLITNFLFIN